ncbi:restriction endonuclease subunit S [Klebsiella pneumoniae]|uniref:restriction endonuclease subunit S n=1 Tax=Klebsiella pneumoniae TaxID=573 RepID=UPI00376FB13D
MNGNEIPQQWVKTTLGHIVDYGRSAKKTLVDVNDNTWVLELEDIEKDSSKLLSKVKASDRKFKSTKNTFHQGDVLYGKLRPYLNKVIMADEDGVCTTEIIPINAEPFCINRYIFFWLKNPIFLRYVREVSYGVNMPRLGTNDGKSAPFYLAPLAEQKIIADKLDDLLARVESIKTRLENIPEILKKFRQSVLSAAVSGKLTEEWRVEKEEPISDLLKEIITDQKVAIKNKRVKKNFGNHNIVRPLFDLPDSCWEWVCFPQISETNNNALKAGPFGSALKKSDCVGDGYKVYGQEQVISGQENIETYRVTESKFEELKSCMVKPGDVLISLVGTIGKVLILSSNAEVGIINPRLVKISLHEKISREYIEYYLGSPFSYYFFKSFSHGGTMEILNLSILKELPIPLPPISEQHEIVRRVKSFLVRADSIEKSVSNTLKRINNLTQSILAKAFRGELTAQWREENSELISGLNSAEALLEKITAEKLAAGTIKKRAKKSSH